MHRMMVLTIQLGVILFATKLGNIFFQKRRMPGVLGKLVAGMLIGPYCPGRIGFYGFEHGLSGTNKKAVLGELVDLLDRAGYVKDRQAALDAVWQREQSMSTGLQHGVAIPHGRTDAVDELVCAVGAHADGVDFGAADGKPSRIFVLVLAPTEGVDPYLQFVAAIMGDLDHPGRTRLLAAGTPDALRAALLGASG